MVIPSKKHKAFVQTIENDNDSVKKVLITMGHKLKMKYFVIYWISNVTDEKHDI